MRDFLAARRKRKLSAIEADEVYPPPRPTKMNPKFKPTGTHCIFDSERLTLTIFIASGSGSRSLEEMYPMVKITELGPVKYSDEDDYDEEKPRRTLRLNMDTWNRPELTFPSDKRRRSTKASRLD